MGRLSLVAPLAVSLMAHAAMLGGLAAGVGGGRSVPVRESVIPVRPAAETFGMVKSSRPESPGALTVFDDASPEAHEPAIPLETADPRYRDYLRRVRKRIWNRWLWPDPAAAPTAGARLQVEFSLARAGVVSAARVRETSGSRALDQAALEAVRRAGPFAPFPATINRRSLTIRAHFAYE